MEASRRSVKAHQSLSSIGSFLSTEFQVYLSKCWDPFVSPGCTIRLVFFCSFSALFQLVILALPLLGLGSKSTSLSPGFCVRRPRQYNMICWELNLISGFFAFLWLIFCTDGINKCGSCLAGDRGCWLNGPHQIPSVS